MSYGRIIVLAGLPGSGKTSIAKALKKDHGFVYFEGDVWSWGDAVAQAESTPTPEDIAKARENADKMKAVMTIGAEFYAKVQQGQQPNYDAAYAFYDMMMKDVLKTKKENQRKDIVVVHAISHKLIRDHVLKVLGENSEIICLDVPHSILEQRNRQRLENRAKEDGKTLREFIEKNFSGPQFPEEYEAKLEQLTNPGTQQLEPLGDDEKKNQLVKCVPVSAHDSQSSVVQKIVTILGLTEKSTI